MPGMMSALNDPTQPRCAMTTNCGTTDSCAGIMNVANRMMNIGFLPGKSNFANTNAAIESKNRTNIVLTPATNTVLRNALQKSMPSSIFRMLTSSLEPIVSFGGNLKMSPVEFVDMTTIQ